MSPSSAITLGLDIGGTSTKLVVRAGRGETLRRESSEKYAQPTRHELAGVIRQLLHSTSSMNEISGVGVCLPGQFEPDQQTVRYSANIPAVCGMHVPSFVRTLFDTEPTRVRIVPDAQASAIGSHTNSPVPGRLLAIALGTGVGASVLDDGEPLLIGPGTCGHFGQIDVSLGDDAPIAPCGGRGSLEGYIGLPALRARFGESRESVTGGIGAMPQNDPALRALARAIRIAHAIYTPDTVRLLGGIGIALEPQIATIKALVDRDLTAVANPDWELAAENDAYLAALGASISAESGSCSS